MLKKMLRLPLYLKKLEKEGTHKIGNRMVNKGPQVDYFTSDDEIMQNVIGNFITIGINLPESKNLLTESALKNLISSIKKFDCSNDIHTAILHGCGGNFCTGIVNSNEAMELSQNLIEELDSLKKPIIAALDGHTMNFGLQLAIMCDIRIMDKSGVAGFHAKGTKLDFPPSLYERLVMNIGQGNTLEILCSRQTWLASECLAAGLVNKIANSGCALGQSMLLAQNITFNTSLEDAIEHKRILRIFLKRKTEPAWFVETKKDLKGEGITAEDLRDTLKKKMEEASFQEKPKLKTGGKWTEEKKREI